MPNRVRFIREDATIPGRPMVPIRSCPRGPVRDGHRMWRRSRFARRIGCAVRQRTAFRDAGWRCRQKRSATIRRLPVEGGDSEQNCRAGLCGGFCQGTC